MRLFNLFIVVINIFFLVFPQSVFAKIYTKTNVINKQLYVISYSDRDKNRIPEATSITGPEYEEQFLDLNNDGYMDVWSFSNKKYGAEFSGPSSGKFQFLKLIKNEKMKKTVLSLMWDKKKKAYKLNDIKKVKTGIAFMGKSNNLIAYEPCVQDANAIQDCLNDISQREELEIARCKDPTTWGSGSYNQETIKACIEYMVLNRSCRFLTNDKGEIQIGADGKEIENPNKKDMIEGILAVMGKEKLGQSSYLGCLEKHGNEDLATKMSSKFPYMLKTPIAKDGGYNEFPIVKCETGKLSKNPGWANLDTHEITFYGVPEQFNVKELSQRKNFYAKVFGHELHHIVKQVKHAGTENGIDIVDGVDDCCSKSVLVDGQDRANFSSCGEQESCPGNSPTCKNVCSACNDVDKYVKDKKVTSAFKGVLFDNVPGLNDFFSSQQHSFGEDDMDMVLSSYKDSVIRATSKKYCQKNTSSSNVDSEQKELLYDEDDCVRANIDYNINCLINKGKGEKCKQLRVDACKLLGDNSKEFLVNSECDKKLKKDQCEKLNNAVNAFKLGLASSAKKNGSCNGETAQKILTGLLIAQYGGGLGMCIQDEAEVVESGTPLSFIENIFKLFKDSIRVFAVKEVYAETKTSEPGAYPISNNISLPIVCYENNGKEKCCPMGAPIINEATGAVTRISPQTSAEGIQDGLANKPSETKPETNPMYETFMGTTTDDYRLKEREARTNGFLNNKVGKFFDLLGNVFSKKAHAAELVREEARPTYFNELFSPQDPYFAKALKKYEKQIRESKNYKAYNASNSYRPSKYTTGSLEKSGNLSDIKKWKKNLSNKKNKTKSNFEGGGSSGYSASSNSAIDSWPRTPEASQDQIDKWAKGQRRMLAAIVNSGMCYFIRKQKDLTSFISTENAKVMGALELPCFIDALKSFNIKIISSTLNDVTIKHYGAKKANLIYRRKNNKYVLVKK